jgi:hypothetical protein
VENNRVGAPSPTVPIAVRSDVRVRIGDGGDHDNTSRNAMKNDAVKNDRRIFKERIKAGEQMRKNHEKILERASEAVDQAMHLFGNCVAVVRVFPETFDLMEKEEKRIAEIDKKLEELRSELDELKGKEAP